jgi:hypothetical protein
VTKRGQIDDWFIAFFVAAVNKTQFVFFANLFY